MIDPATQALLLWLIPLLAATGLLAGMLAGLLGVGGGIVVVPVLYQLFGYLGIDDAVRMHVAVGTSLATIVPTSIRSVRAHASRGAFDRSLFVQWAGAVFIGALAGSWAASLASFEFLTGLFGAVGVIVAVQMILGDPHWRLGDRLPPSLAGRLIPVLIGGLSTMMGIGGGTFSVPVLTLFGVPIHRAVGTSSGFGLMISLPGAVGFVVGGWGAEGLPPLSLGYVNLLGLVLIVPMTLFAVPRGARLAHALGQRALRRAFGVFLGLTAGRMLWDVLPLLGQ